MADIGASASSTATVAGEAASAAPAIVGRIAGDPLAEVDLAIDGFGDLLNIDGAGDDLIVTPAVTWAGATAAEAV